MDFGTIKKKLNLNIYQSVEGFLNDMSQVFINCRLYNGTESPVGRIGVNIRREYDRLLGMYNFVERFQNSQQVHPSVLFIKDLQGNKKENKIDEENPDSSNKIEVENNQNLEIANENKLPLIPEIDPNKIIEESSKQNGEEAQKQESAPTQINEEVQESSKIIEETPDVKQVEPQPEQNEVQAPASNAIQIEEKSVPTISQNLNSQPNNEQIENAQENHSPVKQSEPTEIPSEPIQQEQPQVDQTEPPKTNDVISTPLEKNPVISNEFLEEKSANVLNEVPKEPEQTKENGNVEIPKEEKVKDLSEDSLLNDSVKEGAEKTGTETKDLNEKTGQETEIKPL
jgi:hypothetical protein